MGTYTVEYECGCRIEGRLSERWAKEVCERETCPNHGARRVKVTFGTAFPKEETKKQ